MLARHVALVSQTSHVRLDQLAVVAVAIQKQITRDFGPIWQINGDVAAFGKLSDVPLGYWPIIIHDDIDIDPGIHLNKRNRQPFALVPFSSNWTLTTSHECLEMLADPSGNRVQAGNSIKPGQGRVEFVVEVCGPTEAAQFAYSVNGVLVSDFYTPNFFDPVVAPGVRYSFTGAITEPHQVLDGGFLSWLDPDGGHLFQAFVIGQQSEFIDRGPLPEDFENLRSFSDRHSAYHRMKAMTREPSKNLLLTRTIPSVAGYPVSGTFAANLDRAHTANAEDVQRAIATGMGRAQALSNILAAGYSPITTMVKNPDQSWICLASKAGATFTVRVRDAGYVSIEDAETISPGSLRSEERHVNAWIEDGEPPLHMGRPNKLGVNIGKSRADVVGAGKLPGIDWGESTTLMILIVVSGLDFLVQPRNHQVLLLRNGDTDPVYFTISPRRPGTLLLRVGLYLARDFTLLEEFEIPIKAAVALKAA